MIRKEVTDVFSNALIAFGSVALSIGFALPFTTLQLFVDYPDSPSPSRIAYATFLNNSTTYFLIGGGAIMILGMLYGLAPSIRFQKKAAIKLLIALSIVTVAIVLFENVVLPYLHPVFKNVEKTTQVATSEARLQITNTTSQIIVKVENNDSNWSSILIGSASTGLAAFGGAFASYYYNKKLEKDKLRIKAQEDEEENRLVRTALKNELATFGRFLTHMDVLASSNAFVAIKSTDSNYEEVKRMLESFLYYDEIHFGIKHRLFKKIEEMELLDSAYQRLKEYRKEIVQGYAVASQYTGPSYVFERKKLGEIKELLFSAETKLDDLNKQKLKG